MKTRNKIGFRYEKVEEAVAKEEVIIEPKEVAIYSPAHATLKQRIEATEEFLTSKAYAKLEKTEKQYYIDTLLMFVALDTELNIKSGIGITEEGIQNLSADVKDEEEVENE